MSDWCHDIAYQAVRMTPRWQRPDKGNICANVRDVCMYVRVAMVKLRRVWAKLGAVGSINRHSYVRDCDLMKKR